MNKRLLKTLFLSATLATWTAGAWADVTLSTTTIDGTDYNVRTFDFTSWTGSSTLTTGDNYCKVSGVNLQTVTAPADFTDYIALQGANNGTGNGWWLRQSGTGKNYLYSYGAGRSAAIKNLPENAIVEIYTGNEITFNDATGGVGTAGYTTNTLDGGYSVTITTAGDLGFAAGKNCVITKIVIYTISSGVEMPIGEITNVNGIERTATFSTITPNALLLKSDAKDGTYEQFDGTITTSTTQTVYVKASLNGTESDVLEYTIEAGTSIKLNAPVFAKTAWADGLATYAITNDQNDILLIPAATIACTSEGVDASGASIQLAPGTYTFYATATGYDNSDNVEITVVADRNLGIVESFDYKSNASTYDGRVTLGQTSMYNDGSRDYYSFSYTASGEADGDGQFEANKDVRLLTSDVLYSRNNYGLQNQNTATRYMAITGMKAGQIIKFYCGNTGGIANGIAPTEAKAKMAEESTVSVPAIEVLEDGTIAFSINRLTYISNIEICDMQTVSINNGFGIATFTPSVALDFTNATSIQAYKASVSGDVVTLTKVNTVAAGEGVLIRGVADGATTDNVSEDIPAAAAGTTAAADNAFVGVTSDIASLATAGEGATNYILNAVDGQVGFYQAAGQSVAAGKAYLQLPAAASARFISLSFDGETTGINDITAAGAKVNGTYYTLSGLRVNKPTKGLYILNGKKVVVK